MFSILIPFPLLPAMYDKLNDSLVACSGCSNIKSRDEADIFNCAGPDANPVISKSSKVTVLSFSFLLIINPND